MVEFIGPLHRPSVISPMGFPTLAEGQKNPDSHQVEDLYIPTWQRQAKRELGGPDHPWRMRAEYIPTYPPSKKKEEAAKPQQRVKQGDGE